MIASIVEGYISCRPRQLVRRLPNTVLAELFLTPNKVFFMAKNRDFKTLKIRVSEDEYNEIMKRKTQELSLANWLRLLALDQEIETKRVRRPVPKADPELIREWSKIGSNMNLIARALNLAKKTGKRVDLIKINAVLVAIEARLK